MINIYSLNNIRDQKELNKMEIYKKVLRKCHHRIITCSSKGDTFCFYIIPEYIYGIPKYNTLNCAQYIVNRLKKNKFRVLYTYPNLIYISWNHIPSEIKTKAQLNIKYENNFNNKSNNIKNDKEYRYIEDYNHSKNFMNKIIKN